MSKRAMVTGASSGIGLEFARILARGGYDLAIVARNKKDLNLVKKELKARYGTEVQVISHDLAKQNAADKVYEEVASKGEIDILVNDAGYADRHYLVDADWDKLQGMINLNIMTLTRLSQHAAKDMVDRGNGKILNVASSAAYLPGPMMATYHATKSYVLSFSLALREELRKTGVTVTSLSPGVTRTNFQKVAEMEDSKFVQNRDKMATAHEVAMDGYHAMMDGKAICIPGMNLSLGMRIVSRLPAGLTAKAMHMMYKRGIPKDEK